MSGDAARPVALLICSSGQLAGTRFELGADTMLGVDGQGKLVVSVDPGAIARRIGRIYVVNGVVRLESLGATGELTLDGTAAASTLSLDRRHVIGVRALGEFVYTRVSTGASRAPTPPVPMSPAPSPAPPPAAAQATPPVEDLRRTRLEKDGFDAVPQLRRQAPGNVSLPVPAAAPPRSPARPDDDVRKTRIDKDGFGAVPQLHRNTPHSVPTQASLPTPPSAPQVAPNVVPPTPDEMGTAVGVPGNDPVPMPAMRVASREQEDKTNVFVPPAPPFELAVTLPDAGPVTFPLKFGDNVVGRGLDADIRVPDPNKWLSRKHVIIRVSADKAELIDLAGTNGTFVDGTRISTAVLAAGSAFNLGPNLTFTLRKR